ncbi:MAG TPA: protein kinase [Longimicrobiales bacterium]|nr:protein kinase [Longimicrobiales bacterium]
MSDGHTQRLASALADRYRIERELGEGGMATVYLAEDLKHQRKVAIKVLKPELAAVLGAERFIQEITTTAQLQHPHILPLFDSGAADGFLFYVMPYIEGETLRDRLNREKHLSVEEGVRIAREVADALDYAHRRGVIHRDIKPENILLHDGRPMVADFGIALAVSAAAGGRMTETGMSLGTPYYMSPEQATAEKDLTGRSDVYSLASVLYEMLAGDPPHMGSSAQQIIVRIITDEPRPLEEVRKSVPANVAGAVAKGLEKLPADRFETAKAFADALADAHFTTGASPRAAARGAGRPWWRDRRFAATGAAGVAIGALLVSLSTRPGGRAGPLEYDVGLPDSAGMMSAAQDVGFAVAPAGDFVVYEAVRDGRSELWYRSLLDATVRRIPGSDDGAQPVISPDGRRIAFFRVGDGDWTVEVLPVDGGTSTTLGRGIGIVRKLFWTTPDSILLLQSDARSGRWLDPERGAGATVAMRYCEAQSPIPGTDRVLCGGGGLKWGYQLVLGDSVTEERLWHAEDSTRVFGSSFHVLEGRYLTYVSIGADLLAAPVDLASGRVGRAVRMASGLGLADYTGNASYDIAADGTLVYAQADNRSIGHLVRLRETGIDTLPVGRDAFVTFEYSPDASRLAAVVEGLEGMELRVYDLSSGRFQTWIRRPAVTHPAWSPQGDQLVFSAFDSLFVGAPDRSGAPEFLLHVPGGADALQWMADGRVILLEYESNAILAMGLDQRPVTIDTLFVGNGFTWASADGRWIAYVDRGWTESWIEPLPGDGRRFQVAAGNLADIQWLSPYELGVPITDGSRTRVERVSVDPSANPPVRNLGWWADAPEFRDTNGPSFATAPGGGLMYLQGAPARPASYLRVVPDWVAQMKRAVDEANR